MSPTIATTHPGGINTARIIHNGSNTNDSFLTYLKKEKYVLKIMGIR